MQFKFVRDDRRSDRGQVGIGTLIVFIAMVLVAAIAAGVLINTAGFLQTQAEDTGTQSTDQVADNLNVITTVGTVGSSGDTIEEVQIGVQPAAGAGNINLEEVSIQFVGDNSFANLVHTQKVTSTGQSQVVFASVPVTAEDETDNVMTDSADRYEITVPLESYNPFFSAGGTASDAETYDIVDSDGNDITSYSDGGSIDSADLVTFDGPVDHQSLEGTDTSGDGTVKQSFLDNLDNNALSELVEGEEVGLTMTTEAGGQTVATLKVPDSLAGDSDGDTIPL